MSDATLWLTLSGVALVSSAVSAVAGMAGGMLLIAAMLLFLDPWIAIPVHGAVQLVSNLSRTWFQRRHVRWPVVGRFAWLLLPAGALGLGLASRVPPDLGRLAIGVFVLVATWLPQVFRIGSGGRAERRFVAAGGLVGFANVLFGATGPLLAPFVLSLGLPRQGTVGTLAACQTLGHAAKLLLFGAAGFAFLAYAPGIAALCVAAWLGTLLGTRLLERTNDALFRVGVRLLLTVLALRLVAAALPG